MNYRPASWTFAGTVNYGQGGLRVIQNTMALSDNAAPFTWTASDSTSIKTACYFNVSTSGSSCTLSQNITFNCNGTYTFKIYVGPRHNKYFPSMTFGLKCNNTTVISDISLINYASNTYGFYPYNGRYYNTSGATTQSLVITITNSTANDSSLLFSKISCTAN